ncbi:MAG: N-acetylornithine carbamoyltransferase [Cyclobacteriaceae bacterium]|nr:N-acetylornithine carbamoyltransferase [Cyclobacteriaceae bacterium]MCX7637874.1 N-acetylornithine carbamoyltransferase [Cyclobacteriaceae bacterium]MDW8330495.1 N-acetylornithine carbamoyltransferase [Cyclobacteriaceae bacterium]
MKHFLSVNDVADPDALIRKAIGMKHQALSSGSRPGAGKRIGLLFFNPSLRTRISTQIAAQNLGMEVMVLNADRENWALEFTDGAVMDGATVEHIKDAARVLGRYFDILGVRTFPSLRNKEEDYSEHVLNQFVRYAGIPVVSLESATLHPLQSLADLITISEHFSENRKPRVVLTWAPHIKPLPQCVANSFAQWVLAWNKAELVIAHPQGYELDEAFMQGAAVTHRQEEALQAADFVYVKNWSSVRNYGQLLPVSENWMLTLEKLKITRNARVMHCLPVRRNVELSDEVLDSPASLVTEQASNRVWAAQAVLAEILVALR